MRLMAWLRDLVAVNLGLKLLAVALAIGVQIVIARDGVRDADVFARVRLFGVADNQIFTGLAPESVRLRVRARRVALEDLKAERNLEVAVDLGRHKDGERLLFEPRRIEDGLPVRAVEVVAIDPPSLEVQLDALLTRTMAIEAALSGEAAPGWRANPKAVKIEPATVRVSGPAARVARLTSVRTAPIDLGWAEKDLSVTVRLASPPDRLIALEPDEVKATVHLEEVDLTRTIAAVPIAVRGCPAAARCTVDPPECTLRAEGGGRAVRSLVAKPPDGLVFVDVAHTHDGDGGLARVQTLPLRGMALSPTPAVAKVAIVRDASPPPAPP